MRIARALSEGDRIDVAPRFPSAASLDGDRDDLARAEGNFRHTR